MKDNMITLKHVIEILLKSELKGESFDKDDFESALELAKNYSERWEMGYPYPTFIDCIINGNKENPISVLEVAKEFLFSDVQHDEIVSDFVSKILGVEFPEDLEEN